ncbi:MAG: 16S rRNA (guanine(527)-N(7))-methyltransferase RsmG [Lachnospiraceae bacterium]|nr:16S rRNA (guanine(527)-N(7))-methyltransferase RsmG [Lachnospiraceae bacterium]
MFVNDLKELGISITDKQLQQFIDYYELLVDWNSRMNLTSITEYGEVIKKHFVDSVSLISFYDFSKVESIIDVGTGAGFPGIPLKIMLPDISVLLLDSLNKRVNFLNHVIENISLENINAIHSRAEDAGLDPTYRERYDLCVSRAVANLSTLSEYCLPFVKVGGNFVSYKSADIKDELDSASKALSVLGGNLDKVEEFTIPGTDISRSFVFVNKCKKTGSKYPRKGALPKKHPL